MSTAALIAWVVTALGGLVMVAIWTHHGGLRDGGRRRSRLAPGAVFSHFGVAAAGLAVWIVALVTDTDGLRWVAFALLPVVGAIGLALFVQWLSGRASAQADQHPERHIPATVVAAHGVAALTTVTLVLIAAIMG